MFGLPRVQAHLRALLAMGSPSRRHLRHSLLCTTLGGHDCDLLTITDFSDGDEGEGPSVAESTTLLMSH